MGQCLNKNQQLFANEAMYISIDNAMLPKDLLKGIDNPHYLTCKTIKSNAKESFNNDNSKENKMKSEEEEEEEETNEQNDEFVYEYVTLSSSDFEASIQCQNNYYNNDKTNSMLKSKKLIKIIKKNESFDSDKTENYLKQRDDISSVYYKIKEENVNKNKNYSEINHVDIDKSSELIELTLESNESFPINKLEPLLHSIEFEKIHTEIEDKDISSLNKTTSNYSIAYRDKNYNLDSRNENSEEIVVTGIKPKDDIPPKETESCVKLKDIVDQDSTSNDDTTFASLCDKTFFNSEIIDLKYDQNENIYSHYSNNNNNNSEFTSLYNKSDVFLNRIVPKSEITDESLTEITCL